MKSKIKIIILIFFILIPFVSADGLVIIEEVDMTGWGLHEENNQLCFINYENGFENMILSVDVDELEGNKAVWIFPVPAKPEKTSIDIIKGFPRLSGRGVKGKKDQIIPDVFQLMRASQIYPFIFEVFLKAQHKLGAEFFGADIEIHEHIEKMGLTTELITAEDGTSFYNYLTNKNLSFPSKSISILDEYIGEDYSFVVSWISDIEKFKQEQENFKTKEGITFNTLGVFVKFPTEKIYFPLKPTSVYGSTTIPITIYVMNHVSPVLYSEIKGETQIDYLLYLFSDYEVPDELASFFNYKTKIKDLKYTKIKINTPSKYLIKDLWIKDSAPFSIIVINFINDYVPIWGIILFILSSCLASMFAGMITFRTERISKRKFLLFGLWNFLTLIGFIIATIFLRTKKLSSELEKQLKSQGIVIRDVRKTLFIILFTILFIIINIVFQLILKYTI